MNSSQPLPPTDALTTPPPARISVRRKLVQSTLFPHRSPEIQIDAVQSVDEECDEDNDGEDEERGGSQGKKKGTKRKAGSGTPQKRASKKGKGKSPVSVTPKKILTGNAKVCSDLMEEERVSPPPMPNLMMEAKLANEENSRLFNGKQLYSIFSSCKVRKRAQGMSEEGNNCFSAVKKEGGIGPVHIFEKKQDDVTALDWSGWTFSEDSAINSPHLTFASISESTAKALTFDNYSRISHQLDMSFIQKKEINQSVSQNDFYSRSAVSSCLQVDECVTSCQLSEEREEDGAIDVSVEDMNLQKLGSEQTHRLSYERSIYHSEVLNGLSHNSLWAEKYQPNRASEVCGNVESVKFLSEWLRLWHERDSQSIKDSYISNKGNNLHEDDDYCGCTSDSDDNDDENRLKNVLLVTGPIGCGKSAAIYACAKEQGFEILESNTSEYRTGALVKQKFGEALESHCVARSLENPLDYRNTIMMKSSASLLNSVVAKKVDSEVIDVSDRESLDHVIDISEDVTCDQIKACPSQAKVKSLILFEDVDISSPEERGLVAAIQRISETAKRPVILTTNSTVPVLPDNFDRLELYFTMPSKEELLPCLKNVCAEEKAEVQHYVIEQLIKCCKGDIRRAIMHLQFWCSSKDLKVQKTSVQLPFDIDAAHYVLPNVMPWGFPSKLSALIEEEITKSLSKRTEDYTLLEAVKEGLGDGETFSFGMHNHMKDNIFAKKEEMLSRNFSLEDCREILSPTDSIYEVSNSFGTPVKCSLPMRRRKLMIASSDSEDEHVDRASCLALGKVIDKDLLADTGTGQAEKFEPTSLFSEVSTRIFMDACKSVDISEVPESSFVPETIVEDGVETSSKMVPNGICESFANHNFGNSQPGDGSDVFCKTSEQLVNVLDIFGSSSDIIEESSHEDICTSQTENSEALLIGHYVMDECSCIDFTRRSDYKKNLKYDAATDIVQESWKKLRDSTNLKHCVCSEPTDASHILGCTHQVCDLLSEVDMLLSKPQTLDSSEAAIATFQNSYGYGWCDEQLHMSNIIAQHGFCLCAKKTAAVGSTMEYGSQIDWAEQMLLSSSNTMVLGRLLRRSDCADGFSLKKCSELRLPNIPAESKIKSTVFDIMMSILPSRSYSTLTSNVCHEYMSSLRCISRAETSRLSCSPNKPSRRRGRKARHYLSTGALMLSSEEISFLDESELSGKLHPDMQKCLP